MKKLIQFLKFLFIAEIGPAILTILNLLFTLVYWGPGMIVIGMVFIMVPIAGLSGLVFAYIFKSKPLWIRIGSTTLVALLIAISLQTYQFSVSTPDDLKVVILSEELRDQFKATKGKLLYAGFEHEIYVELESTPELTTKFLASKEFKLQEVDQNFKFQYGPDWFPKKVMPEFNMYEYTDFSTEQKYVAFVTKDQKKIYGFYLAY